MTLRHLQIFRTVCECKSITLAAERLHITQPSVSIAIRELEAFYHARLFDRISRRIYLTEEGAVLRTYTDTLLEQYEESLSVLRSGKCCAKCRLGVNVSAAETFLSRIVTLIRHKLPDITLKIYIHNNEQIDRLLADNQLDFALYDKVAGREKRTAVLLFQDSIAACCPPDWYSGDSISLEQLSEKPLLLREKGSGMRSRIDAEFSKHGYPQNILAESTSTLGLLELSGAGLGYALVPQKTAEKAAAGCGLKILTVTGCNLTKNYYLTSHSQKHLTPASEAVFQTLASLHQEPG